MEPRDFCYWLQGYFEIETPLEIDHEKTKMIKEHLDTVFTKVTGDAKPEITPDNIWDHIPKPKDRPLDSERKYC